MPTITYANELDLSVDDFIAVLNSSGLATRRPVNNRPRLAKMLEKADLTVVARDDTGKIVGVARSITDWSYCLYCSDLAVDKDYQGLGIGKKLLDETVRLSPDLRVHLLVAAPDAVSFYEHAGYESIPDAFFIALGDPD